MDEGAARSSTPAARARLPWLALAAALVVRLVVGVDLWTNDPLTRAPVSDALYYDAWARALAAGEAWRPGEAHWMPPLYPWLLSLLYRATDGALLATLAVQGLAGLGVAWLVALLVQRVAGARAANVAVWLWVLYGPVVLTENRLLAENAALPCVVLGLLAGVGALERLRRGAGAGPAALCTGLCFGLAALARPNLLVGPLGFALGAALDLVRARRAGEPVAPRRACLLAALLALLGASLPLGAGLAANLARSGQPVLVSANGGVNFWLGNNARARGTFAAPGPEWGDIFAQREVAFAGAARALGVAAEALDERAVSRHWFGAGLAWIASAPADALGLAARKLAASLSSHEYDVQVVQSSVRESARSLWLVALPFGVLLALAVLSCGRGVRHGWALLGWLLAVELAVLLYFSYSRFRLPWVPALLPFAAVGFTRLVGAAARPALVAWVLAALALAQSFVPTEGAYARALRANALVDAARALAGRGRDDERRALLERALELAPDDAKARMELAADAAERGDEPAALELLEGALRIDFPPARLALARLLWNARDPAVYDRRRGDELVRDYLDARGPAGYGALEFALAYGDELLRRAAFDAGARAALAELIALLAPVHTGTPAFDELAGRVARLGP